MIRNTDRKSRDYVCTLDTSSPADMELLAAIRKAVSAENKASNNPKAKKRVRVCGRKPLSKATIKCIWTGKTSVAGFTYGGNVVGGIKNAGAVDVYIYDRNF